MSETRIIIKEIAVPYQISSIRTLCQGRAIANELLLISAFKRNGCFIKGFVKFKRALLGLRHFGN